MVAAPPTVWQSQGAVRYLLVPPRLVAVATPRADRPGYFRMLTSSQARDRAPAGTIALVDGTMFSACGGQRPGESDTAYYRRVDCGRPNWRLLDRARGLDVPSRRPRDGLTVSLLADGRAVVQNGDVVADGAGFAAQLYPPLVRRGAVVASNVGSNAQTNWRAGLGVHRDGRLVFAVGRLDMVAFARELAALGAVDAGYTDGGGSGRVVLVANGSMNGSSENRPVPAWFAALPLDAPVPIPPPAEPGMAGAPEPGDAGAPPSVTPPGAEVGAAGKTALIAGGIGLVALAAIGAVRSQRP